MSLRTDLAIEASTSKIPLKTEKNTIGQVNITKVEIENGEQEKEVGKPIGKYITAEFPSLFKLTDYEDIKKSVKEALFELCPQKVKSLLVVGLGNSEITADAVGPKTVNKLLATRHIAGEFAEKIGLSGLHSVSVIAPNVLGKTGIEVVEIVEGIVQKTKPQAVIVIDALASLSINRLFTTIQLSNSGISPGSGVKNSRKELNQKTLGVPVIAVGVPTVVDALSLAFELTGSEALTDTDMIVTPKDSDLLIHRISEILASALNVFLQPEIEEEILLQIV